MTWQNPLVKDSTAQMIVLIGFVIAMIVIGMGTVIYSLSSSGHQSNQQQITDIHDYFINIREEYGTVLMVGSGKGAYSPFNSSNTTVKGFESNMKSIMASHGYILNFTWKDTNLNATPPTAEVTIQLFDRNNRFEDTITYDLITGRILYDLIPPGNITDLNATTGLIDGEIELSWTARGDDGDTGIAYRYDLRYSGQPIDTMEKFDNATYYPINFNPDVNGTPQKIIVRELDPGKYYFAIIVYDEVLHASNLSNCCPSAVAANWSPSVEYVMANDSINSSINLTTYRGRNVTIMFNVTDKDKEELNISLWLDNGSGWYAINHTASWDAYNTTIYNHTIYHINTTWKYYVSVTDGISGHDITAPPGAPASYYWIGGNNSTGAGLVRVTGSNSTCLNLSAPYWDDFNNNNNIFVQYRVNSTSEWNSSNITSNRQLLEYLIYICELNNTLSYDINVTYVDNDGVYPAANITQIIWNQTLL